MLRLTLLVTLLLAAGAALTLTVSSEGRDHAVADAKISGSGIDEGKMIDAGEAEEAETEEGEESEESEEGGEGLMVRSVEFLPNRIKLNVENAGDEVCDLAIVMVDEAIGPFRADGAKRMEPGETRTLTVSYQWVEDDPYEFAIVYSDGGIAEAEVEARPGVATPEGEEEEEE